MAFVSTAKVEFVFDSAPLVISGGQAASGDTPGTMVVEILSAVGGPTVTASVEVPETEVIAAIAEYTKVRGLKQRRKRGPRKAKGEVAKTKAA